jgi:hypothetical protein
MAMIDDVIYLFQSTLNHTTHDLVDELGNILRICREFPNIREIKFLWVLGVSNFNSFNFHKTLITENIAQFKILNEARSEEDLARTVLGVRALAICIIKILNFFFFFSQKRKAEVEAVEVEKYSVAIVRQLIDNQEVNRFHNISFHHYFNSCYYFLVETIKDYRKIQKIFKDLDCKTTASRKMLDYKKAIKDFMLNK